MSVLTEAEELIHGERRQAYGPVNDSFERIAMVWTAILGVKVTREQVGMCMAGLKLVRHAYGMGRDDLRDIGGYSGLLAILEGHDEDRSGAPS